MMLMLSLIQVKDTSAKYSELVFPTKKSHPVSHNVKITFKSLWTRLSHGLGDSDQQSVERE